MIVILAGVAGSGKSTVGRIVATRLGWAYEDSDILHSAADIAKMVSGVPLGDADRWPWLRTVATWMDQQIAAGASAVLACSALKRSYRDYLRRGRPDVKIVLLEVDQATLMARLTERHGHFFPPSCCKASSPTWRCQTRTSTSSWCPPPARLPRWPARSSQGWG